jgi:hypothetical protein
MTRRVFYSFHYEPDNWRVSQIRNIGAIEASKPANDNDWEAIKRGGDAAIKNWIKKQLKSRSCTIVLIGKNTSERKWITYEIIESWNAGMGVFGIYIHKLKNCAGEQSPKGKNPFSEVQIDEANLASIVKIFDPPYKTGKGVYGYISKNLESWVNDAIKIRAKFKNTTAREVGLLDRIANFFS